MGAGFKCQGCPKCNTTFASHPDHHEELQPHTLVSRYHPNTGKPYKMCSQCHYIDPQSYNDAKIKDNGGT